MWKPTNQPTTPSRPGMPEPDRPAMTTPTQPAMGEPSGATPRPAKVRHYSRSGLAVPRRGTA